VRTRRQKCADDSERIHLDGVGAEIALQAHEELEAEEHSQTLLL
jgi:hypothetical protein